jgi:nucleotide-binding universal stress UspA family protein
MQGIQKGRIKMLPIKKILFPTDFSEPSYEALKAATEVASHFSAEMVVVHVIHPFPAIPAGPVPAFNVAEVLQEMEAAANDSLRAIMEEKIPGTVASSSIVAHGGPADEIVRIASDQNADLIVIATHGLTGWRRFVFGSVAQRVVRLARCPVLTICSPEEAGEGEA